MGSKAHIRPSDNVTGRQQSLLHNRDFLVPYLAESQSIAGDQIGRVALSILVFNRTSSVAWTALTYALTYLPAILGGVVLGGLGDRFPRVWVMVIADVARAALFLGVAICGVPLPVVVLLVAVAFFLGPAFTAAMVSRLAASLTPARFRAASGIRMVTAQVAQVGGFAVGGVIVAVVNPYVALMINAGTFAASALIVGLTLARRDHSPVGQVTSAPEDHPGIAAPNLLRDPLLRHLMQMTALAAFFVVPEGLAVPIAHHLGASSQVAGLLLAAGPLGSAVGAASLVRFVEPRRGLGVARVMSIACGIPLIATVWLTSWPLIAVCWALSGVLWAYQVDVATALVNAVSDSARSRTLARASAILLGAQGCGLIGFGALGTHVQPATSVGIAGLVGVVAALSNSVGIARTGVDS